MAYTVQDTPDVVRRIESDLDHVVETVRHGDPSLRSLVLTGGFARGEGAVLDGRPQNDYDLVAVRGVGRPRVPYARMRQQLEDELGLHMDLAPVGTWRLRGVPPSVFWYETALRGQVLWGEDVLHRLPAHSPAELESGEGMRLLVNRAAGLLFSMDQGERDQRIQASKAFLAVLDANLLAAGVFPPSQTERWRHLQAGEVPEGLRGLKDWLAWAYRYKTDPGGAPQRSGKKAWLAAARAIDGAVPVALHHAGHRSLDEYARHDGLLDRLYYLRQASRIPEARRFLPNPTGQVRAATIRMLRASLDGSLPPDAPDCLKGLVRGTTPRDGARTLGLLEGLRNATLQ